MMSYLSLIIWIIGALGATPATNPQPFCASDFFRDAHQDELDQLLASGSNQGSNRLMPYTLPVVVHIIHNNGPENITDAQVLTGMQHLNEAFANQGYYDQGTGVNTLIQFCLATRDPDGLATTGINRVVSPLTNMNFNTQDLAVKDLIRWDPLNYINIWLVGEICNDNGCGVAGYAYFPSAHGSNVDGIVMEANWFGSTFGNSGVQIHEMGHYLGLYHTFEGGCSNADCALNGDRVCDTPPDQSTAPVPCGGSNNSCTTDTQSGFATDQPDMFWNYMDYGIWDCYSAFTAGQADRMYWHIDNVRFSLLESEACLDPCTIPLAAGFTPSATQVNIGSTVNFTNTSTNATGYQWLIDGVPFSAGANPAYTFNTLGTFVIALEISNADPNCSDSWMDTITVVCPVEPGFTTSNLFPLPGEIVDLANTSMGANTFSWTVNGSPLGTTPDIVFVPPAPGAYYICLEAGNGLCGEEVCQLVFSFQEEGGCNSGFLKTIGEEGSLEAAYSIIPLPDGTLMIGGGKEGESVLINADYEGNILWEKAFKGLAGGEEFVRALYLDSEGQLILTGRDAFVVPDQTYIAKFDLTTENFIWFQTFEDVGFVRLESMLEDPSSGNYIFYGFIDQVGTDNYVFEVEKNTGAFLWQKSYDLGGSTDHYINHEVHGNNLYLVGAQRYDNNNLDKIRASVHQIDFDGNFDWVRTYFHSQPQLARTYFEDIVIQGDTLVLLGRGSFTGSNLTNSGAHLAKTDLDGNLLWGRSYYIVGGTDIYASTLHLLNDGYLIQGLFLKNGAEELFFIRVDFAGNIIWAKSVGEAGDESSLISLVAGEVIFFVGNSNSLDAGGGGDILLGSLPLDGFSANPNCSWVEDLEVYNVFIQNNFDDLMPLVDSDSTYQWTSQAQSAFDTETPSQTIAGCECTDTIPCQTTYYQNLVADGTESGRRIIPEPGGGFILGGNKNDSTLIALLDSEGNLIWERAMKITTYPTEFVTDLLVDSEGMLAGVGYGVSAGNIYANFMFRYDYQNNTILWAAEPNPAAFNTSILLQIEESGPGGNYIIAGQTSPAQAPGSGCDGVLIEINRTTGAQVWLRNYQLGSCETFSAMLLHANSIYTTGRYNFAGGGTDKMRGAISQFDLNGAEIWSRLYLVNVSPNFNARLYTQDMVVDNGLVVAGSGDLNGASATDVEIQLFKTDFSGDILWARQYNIPGGESERFTRLLNLPDGYLGLGNYTTPSGPSLFLLKTDKNGILQWAKTYAGVGYDLLFHNGILYLTGASGADILLARLNLDGELNDPCASVSPLTVTDAPIVNPYDGLHPLTAHSPVWSASISTPSVLPTQLTPLYLCQTPCVDSCLAAPDAFISFVSGACAGDSLSITLEVCNQGAGILYAGTPVTFYLSDPTAGPALAAGAGQLPADIQQGECAEWTLLLDAPQNTQVFAVVNEDGTTLAPFDLADEGYTGFDSLECEYLNNLSSFQVVYTPSLLDLGPDTAMCGFGVVTLQAQSGFAQYEWTDGSFGPVYTALEPGLHWVTVIDSCGGVQSDSVLITSFSDALGTDTLALCPGDTLVVGGQSVTQPGEYPDLLTGFNGCDSVVTYVVVFSTDTIEVMQTAVICSDSSIVFGGQTLTVSGQYTFVDTTGACVYQYLLDLTVNPVLQTSDSLSLCDGDTVLIFGSPVWTAGQYSQVFNSVAGCDSTHTVQVSLLPTVATSEDLVICENDTADIFGTPTLTAGTYTMVFAGANGCDSTHTINLSVTDTVLTQEDLSICFGETAVIFGTQVSAPGAYSQTFTGANGCDSTHVINLTVAPQIFLQISAQNTCEGEETGTATLTATSAQEPYTIVWSGSTATGETISGLAAGGYSVTLTDSNGCSASASFIIEESAPPVVGLETADAGCEGAPEGQIIVVDGQQGYLYSLDGTNFSSDTLFAGLAPGGYTLFVDDGQGCIGSFPVEIGSPPVFQVSLPDTLVIELGQSLELNPLILPGGVYLYAWAPPEGLDCVDCPNPQASPGLSTTYTLLVTDADGCVVATQVVILVEEKRRIYIPNVFSPDFDGINDQFTVFGGREVAEVQRLQVFDRWGEMVFERLNFPPNDLGFGWDGTFRGLEMNPAVFTYLAEVRLFSGQVILFSGDVTLMR